MADFLFGFNPMVVTIVSNEEKLTFGTTRSMDRFDNGEEAQKMVVSMLAGHAAEVEFCGKEPAVENGARSDFEEARRILSLLSENLATYLVKAIHPDGQLPF